MKIRYYTAILTAAVTLAAVNSLRADSPTAEDKLIDVLKSGAAVDVKANACRELKLAGTEKSIPVLASFLTDADLSHPARYALESMPYPAAGAALREALGKATGLARSGVIDSLGQRRDPLAIPLLAPDLANKDIVLVAAAATALGKIGTLEAASLLTTAWLTAQDAVRIKIDDGLLVCADRLRLAGKVAEAAKIYDALSPPSEPRLIRAARCTAACKWPARKRPASSPSRWVTMTPWCRWPPQRSCMFSPTPIWARSPPTWPSCLPRPRSPCSRPSASAAAVRWPPQPWRRPRVLTNRSAWRPRGRWASWAT